MRKATNGHIGAVVVEESAPSTRGRGRKAAGTESPRVKHTDKGPCLQPRRIIVKESGLNFRRYYIECTGLSAIMFDAMSDETLDLLRTKAKKEKDTSLSTEEIARDKLYLDDNNNVTIPVSNMLACLNNAATLFKYDAKRSIATGSSSKLPMIMRIPGEYLDFRYETSEDLPEGWKPDQRRGVLAATGVAVAIVRPKFKNWSIRFVFELNDDEPIKVDIIAALIAKAGLMAGLGSFRPEKKGSFGQFIVSRLFEVPEGWEATPENIAALPDAA